MELNNQMIFMRFSITFLFVLLLSGLSAQQDAIYNDDPFQKLPLGLEESEYHYRYPTGEHFTESRVEPTHWWVDMAHRELEILLYDKDIQQYSVQLEYPGVSLLQVTRLENPNYLFVLIDIGPGTKAGVVPIQLLTSDGTVAKSINYELKERGDSAGQGVSSEDLIYLIMPDRFANGDKGNDSVDDMAQTGTNRDKFFFRHGGDLIGIMEHLDYLEDLGITALWLNPVIENDQPYESYHGYAPTDHYAIDSRFGSNEQYRQLVQLAHERGIKVIMDVVFNHVGDHHWQIKDLPARDWIHQWEDGYRTISYRAPVHLDPHGAKADFEAMTNSWFDRHMPDLNQQHPQVANYLIQNSIWWTEYSKQDGFRIDTYAYCDQTFNANWNQRLLQEYPEIGIYAETWVHGPGIQSWFAEGARAEEHNSHLPGVTDFQMYYAINEALNSETGWTSGANRLYYTVAQDYLYEDPTRNVLFLDNHDLGRVFGVVGEDMTKFKSAISLLLTMRGIPMLYYGTEVLMTGSGGAFGEGGRKDFPGGFPRDKTNYFKEKDREANVAEAFNYLRTLARYRKAHPVLQTGQLTQYIPVDGVYVYFRHNTSETVMVVFNGNDEAKTIDTDHYGESMAGFTQGIEIVKGDVVGNLDKISVDARATLVLRLQ